MLFSSRDAGNCSKLEMKWLNDDGEFTRIDLLLFPRILVKQSNNAINEASFF